MSHRKISKNDVFNCKLEALLKSKIFHDVTFNCRDGKTQGNRLILSVYSSLLRNLFNSTPLLTSHPVYSHPENGIVLLESSIDDVNTLLELVSCRRPVELALDQWKGVKQIAKEFEIKLISNKCGPRRMLCKPVIQVVKNDEESTAPDIIREDYVMTNDEDDVKLLKLQNKNGTSEQEDDDSKVDDLMTESEDDDGDEDEDLGDDNDHSVDFRPNSKLPLTSIKKAGRKPGRPRSTDRPVGRKPGKKSLPSGEKASEIESMFTSQDYFTITMVNGARVFECKSCPKQYDNQSKIRNHFQVKHLPLTFYCTKCTESYDARYKVVKHIREEHNIQKGHRHYYSHTMKVEN